MCASLCPARRWDHPHPRPPLHRAAHTQHQQQEQQQPPPPQTCMSAATQRHTLLTRPMPGRRRPHTLPWRRAPRRRLICPRPPERVSLATHPCRLPPRPPWCPWRRRPSLTSRATHLLSCLRLSAAHPSPLPARFLRRKVKGMAALASQRAATQTAGRPLLPLPQPTLPPPKRIHHHHHHQQRSEVA